MIFQQITKYPSFSYLLVFGAKIQSFAKCNLKPEETEEQIEQLKESMRVYKKWRRNQIALFGAEKLQEQEDQVKKIKQKVVSVGAKYVPSSIQEIQMGTTLDIAKQSRVSFDPDNTLGDEPAEDHEIEDKPTENSVDEVSKKWFC